MFKKFSRSECSGHSQVKSSTVRGIRKKILETYPSMADEIDFILPKKTPVFELKWNGGQRTHIIVCQDEAWFFTVEDLPILPTLRCLHKYPDLLPKVQVDRGAIKYVMSGAHIMCRGLTSKGGKVETDLPTNVPVAVQAEGKQHALAIGYTKMSTDDMKKLNTGIGIDSIHHLGDGLWTVLDWS